MVKPHKIKENSGLAYPTRFIFADTETTEWGNDFDIKREEVKLKFWEACYTYYDVKKEKEWETWKGGKNKGEFWGWVESKIPDKTKLILFFHNANFDFMVLDGFRELKDRGWDLDIWIWDNQKVILGFRKGTKTLKVLDSMNYFMTSIAVLGKSLGLPKLERKDYDSTEADFRFYCQRDVEILKRTMQSFIAFLYDNRLCGFCDTIAQTAFKTFRHKYMKHSLCVHNNKHAVTLERAAYKGGRTECFYIGEVEDSQTYKLDINSMYPFVMRDHKYPTKLIRYIHEPDMYGLLDALTKYLVIADVEIEINDPAIGTRDERLLFPVGRFRETLSTPELNFVLEYGKIIKVYSYAIYKGDFIFTDFVTELYNMRMDFERQGNESYKLMVKYILNSLYGKFGQRKASEEIIGEVKEADGSRIEVDLDTGEQYTVYIINGKEVIKRKTNQNSYNSMVSIAAHVTAYARMYLWQLIKIAGRDNVFYVDTDSLFVNQEGYDNLKPVIEANKLGKLKIEAKTDHLVIHNVKDYQFGDKLKLKGVKKEAVRDKDGVYWQYQIEGLRGRLKSGHSGDVVAVRTPKHISIDYKKGNVTTSGWIKPFVYPDEAPDRSGELTQDEKNAKRLTNIGMRMEKEDQQRVKDFMQSEDNFDLDSTLEADEQQAEAKREMMRWMQPEG